MVLCGIVLMGLFVLLEVVFKKEMRRCFVWLFFCLTMPFALNFFK